MELIEGNYYKNILCESFKDSETGRIRVRPLPDQGFPTNVIIECSKKIRMEHPLGTVFRTENVLVTRKPGGRIHLRAKDQMIYKVD